MTRRHATIDTRLGLLTLIAEGDALLGVYFPGHWYLPPPEAYGAQVDAAEDALFSQTHAQFGEYLTGARTAFDLPIDPRGNEFQRQVWTMLLDIPYGATTSYGELAVRLGSRSLSQGVGQAVGHNPLSVIIPCHRVVGHDGRLTGYAGGLERKKLLLELEEPEEARAARLF